MPRIGHQRSLASGFATIVFIGALATLSSAQQPPVPLSVKQLSADVYWTQGGAGGNTGIIIGKDGVIVVDAKTTADSARQVLAEVAKLTPKPVTTVILTHSDGDHVNGLAAFPTGLTIISTEECRKEMLATAGSRNPAPQDHLPTKTVDQKESLTINGVHLDLLHFAPAHTDGDLILHLPDERVVFTGDIIAGNLPEVPYAYIHLNKHGSSEGWIRTMRGILALKANNFVPGHGDLKNRADLQKLLADTQQRRNKIKKLFAEGKSLNEVKTALGEPLTAPTPTPGAAPNIFTEVVYTELSKT